MLPLAAVVGASALVASSGAGQTSLRITVWPQGRAAAQVRRYRLACAPARGTVPHRARACRVLGRLGPRAFAPTPPGVACSAIYGGPAQARVRGLVAGRRVDTRLRLTNGCEIDRWHRVAAVVPKS